MALRTDAPDGKDQLPRDVHEGLPLELRSILANIELHTETLRPVLRKVEAYGNSRHAGWLEQHLSPGENRCWMASVALDAQVVRAWSSGQGRKEIIRFWSS